MEDFIIQDDSGNWWVLTDSSTYDLLDDSDISYYVYGEEE